MRPNDPVPGNAPHARRQTQVPALGEEARRYAERECRSEENREPPYQRRREGPDRNRGAPARYSPRPIFARHGKENPLHISWRFRKTDPGKVALWAVREA